MEKKITLKGIKRMLYTDMYIYIRYDMRDNKFYLVEWDNDFQYEKVIQEISDQEWDIIREDCASFIDVKKERYFGNKKWAFYWK